MSKNIELCEVIDLEGVKKHCPQIIKECDICGGIIIDHDSTPEQYIVDYSDRHIHSAVITCVKCGAEVCENCVKTIDDTWEKIYICTECYEKYKKRIDKIIRLQKRANAIAEEIADEIEEFLNDN